jgi:hypothetical protein
MSSLALAIPLPPGKTEAWRRFTDELKGPRRAEMHDMLRRAHLTQHNFYLQQTPQGDLAIVYLEGTSSTPSTTLRPLTTLSSAGYGGRRLRPRALT